MKNNKQQNNDRAKDHQFNKGLWSVEEDKMLLDYVKMHGNGRWNRVIKKTGLKRSGKSCRLRWMNYLCPSVKRERFTEDEDDLIIRLHNLLGNRWALIAGRVPGRTDNQVKNYWNTHLSKKVMSKQMPDTLAHYKPDINDNCNLKSCYNNHNESKGTEDDQIITSDFSSNENCGTSKPRTGLTTESGNDRICENISPLLGTSQGHKARSAAEDDGSWFIQHLDDYSLNYVLNSNQRNTDNAAYARV